MWSRCLRKTNLTRLGGRGVRMPMRQGARSSVGRMDLPSVRDFRFLRRAGFFFCLVLPFGCDAMVGSAGGGLGLLGRLCWFGVEGV